MSKTHIILLPPPSPNSHRPPTLHLTTLPTPASDFLAWNFPVQTYPSSHHNILALRTLFLAEGIDVKAREEEMLDRWVEEGMKRWRGEYVGWGRVGRVVAEREDRGRGVERKEEKGWDFGGAVGMGGGSFGEGVKRRRERSERRERRGWWWWGRDGGDGEVEEELPVYSRGEEPPGYEA